MGKVWESIQRYDADADDFVDAHGHAVRAGDRIRFERDGEVGEITVSEVTPREPNGHPGALHANLGDGLRLTISPDD